MSAINSTDVLLGWSGGLADVVAGEIGEARAVVGSAVPGCGPAAIGVSAGSGVICRDGSGESAAAVDADANNTGDDDGVEMGCFRIPNNLLNIISRRALALRTLSIKGESVNFAYVYG